MQVVLRQDVDNLGLRGEVVNVARGYARNYLLPRGLAEVSTPALRRELEKREAQRARHEAKTADEAQAIANRLEAMELRFDVNAGPTGTLFGSVTATNIADRLWEAERIRVDRRKLQLEAIKHVGRYTVPVEIFAEVSAGLRLVVAPEGVELPTEEELAAAAAAAAEAEAAEAAAASEPAGETEAAAEQPAAATVEEPAAEPVEEAPVSSQLPGEAAEESAAPAPEREAEAALEPDAR
jgi:large subunit ribosomal protein L9